MNDTFLKRMRWTQNSKLYFPPKILSACLRTSHMQKETTRNCRYSTLGSGLDPGLLNLSPNLLIMHKSASLSLSLSLSIFLSFLSLILFLCTVLSVFQYFSLSSYLSQFLFFLSLSISRFLYRFYLSQFLFLSFLLSITFLPFFISLSISQFHYRFQLWLSFSLYLSLLSHNISFFLPLSLSLYHSGGRHWGWNDTFLPEVTTRNINKTLLQFKETKSMGCGTRRFNGTFPKTHTHTHTHTHTYIHSLQNKGNQFV